MKEKRMHKYLFAPLPTQPKSKMQKLLEKLTGIEFQQREFIDVESLTTCYQSKKPYNEKRHFALEDTLSLRLTNSEGLWSYRFGGGFIQVQFEGEEINTEDIQNTMNVYLKHYKAPNNNLEDCCRCCAIS